MPFRPSLAQCSLSVSNEGRYCGTSLVKCSKCNEKITFSSCNKIELKNLMKELDLLTKPLWRQWWVNWPQVEAVISFKSYCVPLAFPQCKNQPSLRLRTPRIIFWGVSRWTYTVSWTRSETTSNRKWRIPSNNYAINPVINPQHMRQRVMVVVLCAYVCYHFNCYVPPLQVENKVPLVFS